MVGALRNARTLPNSLTSTATKVPRKRPHFSTPAEMSRERSSPCATIHLRVEGNLRRSDLWTQCDYAISSTREFDERSRFISADVVSFERIHHGHVFLDSNDLGSAAATHVLATLYALSRYFRLSRDENNACRVQYCMRTKRVCVGVSHSCNFPIDLQHLVCETSTCANTRRSLFIADSLLRSSLLFRGAGCRVQTTIKAKSIFLIVDVPCAMPCPRSDESLLFYYPFSNA